MPKGLKPAKTHSKRKQSPLEQSLKNKRRRLAQAVDAESQRAMERARVQGEFAILSSKLEKDHGISLEQADEASFQGLGQSCGLLQGSMI
ncbi:MAG: hypothetical protein MZU79_03355 [Anaerotruncus sp.]|nr:hypothetical protein [Anaerotruncus sp.]